MVISINDASEIPIYQQIRNQIVLGISDGRLALAEQLPTVRGTGRGDWYELHDRQQSLHPLKQEATLTPTAEAVPACGRNFETNKELSEKSRNCCARFTPEAKVSGMTQTEFFD